MAPSRNAGFAGFTANMAAELSASLPGRVFPSGTDEYEISRKVWNGTIDQYPALVVHATESADIVVAVKFASKHGLGIAIKATGHGALKAADADAILIDTSRMKHISVDPVSRTATLGPGVTAVEFLDAIQKYQLIGPTPVSQEVGMTGYTLAGGYGDLPRVTALSSDNLVSADIVLTDGRQLTASETENRDLFWALRGGGGNFGIVTSMTLRLHKAPEKLLAGVLSFDATQARQVIGALRAWNKTIPDEMTLALSLFSANVAKTPNPIMTIALVYFGEPDDGMSFIDKLIESTHPVSNTVKPQTYADYFHAVQDPGFGLRNYWHGVLLDELTDPVIDVLQKTVSQPDSSIMLLFSYYRGGAWSRKAEDYSAVSHRHASWLLNGRAIFPRTEGDDSQVAKARKEVADLAAALAPFGDHAVPYTYVEYEGPSRLHDVYGAAKLQRLRELKHQYDPRNLLRFNANIPPLEL